MKANVVGIRWQWTFEYPEYGVTSKELHLVVGKQVVLSMTAPEADVIHSFWVPEFRIKQDVVPGRVTEYRVTPIEVGAYKVRCAELCGTSHSYMEAAVIVESQEAFDAWIKAEQAAAAEAAANLSPAERGQKLVAASGCAACHSLDGAAGVGPTWKGVFGEEAKLADGSTVEGDEEYLFESIKNPNAKIVEGYQPNAMPQYSFTDAQIADIVEYLKTVK
jgi:cytochrome c oxidase subunit 2